MDNKDSSSLPLLLVITGSILVVAVGGWFFLEQEETVTTTTQSAAIMDDAPFALASAGINEPLPVAESVGVVRETAPAVTVVDAPATGIAVELRKARLAAEADILVLPAEQSALHYYGRVLDAEPGHEVANAELDAMLARVAQSVSTQLAAGQFNEAFEIAALVARTRPNHELVIDVQQALDNHTEELVQQALQLTRNGNDDAAELALATAEGLPARNPDYFEAVRASIAEIRDARRAAEDADRRQRAADDARNAWVQSVRGAIARGDLITPAGSSARDLLAQSNNWANERTRLNEELFAALAQTATTNIASERLDETGALIDAAADLGADPDRVGQLRGSLEDALAARQSRTSVPLSQLVRTRTVAPEYPQRAARYNRTGYVDLAFTVTTEGSTTSIEVLGADPEYVFDKAAIEAVEQWEFEPVEYRGRIIDQRTAARLVFELE